MSILEPIEKFFDGKEPISIEDLLKIFEKIEKNMVHYKGRK